MLWVQGPPAAAQTRLEFHYLPPVSSGPTDPSVSPDGGKIAFAARGDLWAVPVGGGDATGVTSGPAYAFQPEYSPDGSWLAFTHEDNGNLDIAIIGSAGGDSALVTAHPARDLEAAWSADSDALYFVSDRQGDMDIYRVVLGSGAPPQPVVQGRGHQLHPAVSPDGRSLAYVAPVSGRLGSGGIWTVPLGVDGLPSGTPRLIHYEETSYRARPTWLPDGRALVYVSDDAGSDDLMMIPFDGGNRVRLTWDIGHEITPVATPDGAMVVFVTNRNGLTSLASAPVGGGAGGGHGGTWAPVRIDNWRPRFSTGGLEGRVLRADGSGTPARLIISGADGRFHAPGTAFRRVLSSSGIHYSHTADAFEVTLPTGMATIEAMSGLEYVPAFATVRVEESQRAEVELVLDRAVDAPLRGWWSGDTHTHDLHQGRHGLTHKEFFAQSLAEDLHITNALIHMDGTRLMGRWADLTGEPHPLSDSDHILFYGQEFRGSFGHVALLGIAQFITPLIAGVAGTVHAEDVLKVRYLDEAKFQEGISGYVHPYNGPTRTPAEAATADIPLHVALGRGDFYDVVSTASDERASAAVYARMLNCGFRIAATGGTDNFSDVWLDPSPGTARTYARIDGNLSYGAWLEAIREYRTFGTNGPLLFLTVNGHEPGDTIELHGMELANVQVEVELVSIFPIDRLELLLNGRVIHTEQPRDAQRQNVEGVVRLKLSHALTMRGPGWIAARAEGPGHRLLGDRYAYAHTSPVWLTQDGKSYTSATDAKFLLATVDELWRLVDGRNRWQSEASRDRYLRAVDKARAVYQGIIDGS